MEFLKKLKGEKKSETVIDSLIKKRVKKEEPVEKSVDMEVTQITPERASSAIPKEKEPVIKREFRTEGIREFDIDSLSADSKLNIKIEYKNKIGTLIDEGKIDEAIDLLKELKDKLGE